MGRKKLLHTDMDVEEVVSTDSPDAGSHTEPAPAVEDTPFESVITYTYVGPRYNYGIWIPTQRLVRPAELSDEEIQALVAEWPPAAEWYLPTH